MNNTMCRVNSYYRIACAALSFLSISMILWMAACGRSTQSCTRGEPRFEATEPLGINIDDVGNLRRLANKELTALGFIDITAAPFSADPTGAKDSTKSIREAVFFGRHHKLAIYFPAGIYLVSDTIECRAGLSDERTPNHKYLPYIEVWPVVLIGDRRGPAKPVIRLLPRSPGFDDPGKPKPVFYFDARGIRRKSPDLPLDPGFGYTSLNQALYGINVEIGEGNPGAAAVSFDAAEGSVLQDCAFDVGGGYAGIYRGPGSGGAVFNVEIRGGRFGAHLSCPRPTVTLVGVRFSGQREAAVFYRQRGTLTLVGGEFQLAAGVPALRVDGAALGSASLVDCRIDYENPSAATKAIEANAALYVRNTWIRNAPVLTVSPQQGEIKAPGRSAWTHIAEMAIPYKYTKVSRPLRPAAEPWGPETPLKNALTASVYVDGRRLPGDLRDIRTGEAPPADLGSRHIWDAGRFPYWNHPKAVNVKAPPYCAKGDGVSDDHGILQRAIDENEIVFLPKGAYRTTRTLKLKSNTKLIGVSPAYSMIVPMATPGGDFEESEIPKPVLRTADTAAADTMLAFFGVFMPRELVKTAYMLDWACGGRSLTNCVFPITGLTENDVVPLKKQIYPWTNWRWDDMTFALALGGLKHYNRSPLGADTREGGIPNWPLILVHGNGGGGFYPFQALDGREHGKRYRRILVNKIKGPFSVYHAHLQYCRGEAEMEVVGSSNVAIYGIKNEIDSAALWVRDSSDVLMTGYGGPGETLEGGKFVVERSSNVVLANLLNDFSDDRADARNPTARLVRADGRSLTTAPFDRPVVFKVRGK